MVLRRVFQQGVVMQISHSSVIAATVLVFSPVTSALAHHGWAGQAETLMDLTGKVHKPVSLAGPHATMQIMANGQVWEVTLAPPARTESAGLTPTALKVGDTVTVRGNRNSDPKRFEMKTVRVSSGDRNFDVYPDRIK
jgi:hypothetical protein